MSLVSMYNQIIAKTETRGTDASIPPIKELFFDASEIATIKIAERATLIMYCHMFYLSIEHHRDYKNFSGFYSAFWNQRSFSNLFLT